MRRLEFRGKWVGRRWPASVSNKNASQNKKGKRERDRVRDACMHGWRYGDNDTSECAREVETNNKKE